MVILIDKKIVYISSQIAMPFLSFAKHDSVREKRSSRGNSQLQRHFRVSWSKRAWKAFDLSFAFDLKSKFEKSKYKWANDKQKLNKAHVTFMPFRIRAK